jgi:hypothetical protein
MTEKIVQLFPDRKNEEVIKKDYPAEEKKEVKAELDIDKLLWFMGKLSALRKASPELFKKEKVDHEMEVVGGYSDYALIMKINNCTENSIQNNPCLYLAINYEAWNRNLSASHKKEK